MKRILLAATGSLGDLHPMLAIGLGLKQRGHSAIIAKAAAEAARRVRAEDAVRAACDAIEECADGKRVLTNEPRPQGSGARICTRKAPLPSGRGSVR